MTRLVHSEGAQGNPADRRYIKQGEKKVPREKLNPTDRPFVDVVSRMYATAEVLNSIAVDTNDNRPIFNCEFAHAMGNSLGNLKEYLDGARAHDNIIGGAIWDYIDQGIDLKTEDGMPYWGYGNDAWENFGHHPRRFNFLLNGIINPDRSTKPALIECKKVFQPIEIKSAEGNEFKLIIKNWHHFTNLNEYNFSWTLLANGRQIKNGELPTIDCEPSAQKEVFLQVKNFKKEAGIEYVINISAKLNETNLYAEAGYEVAWQDIVLPVIAKKEENKGSDMDVEEDNDAIYIKNSNYALTINRKSGFITSYNAGNKELLLSPLQPNFVRASTDNDRARGNKIVHSAQEWKTVADSFNVSKIDVNKNKVIVYGTSVFDAQLQFTYEFLEEGVKVSLQLNKADDTPPLIRFGLQTTIPANFATTEYYGKGPHENYWDRQQSARLALHTSATNKIPFSYIYPQENGNRCDVRSLKLISENQVLQVDGYPTIDFSIWPYTQNNLEEAKHTFDLKTQDFYTLNIDYKQLGVGGDNSWGQEAMALPAYRLDKNEYSYSFLLKAVDR